MVYRTVSTSFCFYLNVTTLRSGICSRLSSVTFMRHTKPVESFGNVSMPFCTLAFR